MSLLTIYRVEDDLAKGPYINQAYRNSKQAEASHELARRHSDGWLLPVDATAAQRPEVHPGPEDDRGMRDRWRFMNWSARRGSSAYNFGFESTDRLGKWFFGERKTLELLNMHVAAYTVPHQAVIRGEWQLAFRRPSATLQSTMGLKGLVE
jgi:hypothetical protein